MKILIFGLGSIGKRHARLLRDENHEVFAFRSDRQKRGNDLNLPEIFSWEEVETIQPEAAFITNPTYLHLETALPCAERGMALFIEKPIDASTRHLDRLIHLVESTKIPTYVAYVLRFHPVVRGLKEELKGRKILKARFVSRSWLPDWRPGQNHLKSYSAHRDMGGGALLDLSHEFDLAEYLFGPVQEITGRLERRGQVTIDAEDFVEGTVRCPTVTAEIVIDIASKETERTVSVETDQGTFTRDLQWTDRDLPYREQLHYFLDHRKDPGMMNNLHEASDLFKQLVAFRQAVA